MRKLLITAIYMFSISLIIGQDDIQEVWSTWYIKPLHGKAKQLEKGLIDHVKKHHGQGEWPEYYFEILIVQKKTFLCLIYHQAIQQFAE